jgi:hypothetical protein
VECGDRCPGGVGSGEHERLALDGGALLVGKAEAQHEVVIERKDLGFATGCVAFELVEPDLGVHGFGDLSRYSWSGDPLDCGDLPNPCLVSEAPAKSALLRDCEHRRRLALVSSAMRRARRGRRG